MTDKKIKTGLVLRRDGKIFVIQPAEDLNIGRLEKDPENVQRVYDIGSYDGEKYIDDMIKWLGEGK